MYMYREYLKLFDCLFTFFCVLSKHNATVRTLHFEGNDVGAEGAHYIAELLTENFTITSLVSGKKYSKKVLPRA